MLNYAHLPHACLHATGFAHFDYFSSCWLYRETGYWNIILETWQSLGPQLLPLRDGARRQRSMILPTHSVAAGVLATCRTQKWVAEINQAAGAARACAQEAGLGGHGKCINGKKSLRWRPWVIEPWGILHCIAGIPTRIPQLQAACKLHRLSHVGVCRGGGRELSATGEKAAVAAAAAATAGSAAATPPPATVAAANPAPFLCK